MGILTPSGLSSETSQEGTVGDLPAVEDEGGGNPSLPFPIDVSSMYHVLILVKTSRFLKKTYPLLSISKNGATCSINPHFIAATAAWLRDQQRTNDTEVARNWIAVPSRGKDVITVRRKIEPSARVTPVAADLVTPPYGHACPMVIDGAAVTHPTSFI